MGKYKSIIFEGKSHPVVRVHIENRVDPPPPNQRDFPIPAPPPAVAKLMERRGDHAVVRAWLEKQTKPYYAAVAQWEKQWAGKARFSSDVEIEMASCRWHGYFMGQPGGKKFSEADLRGAKIGADDVLTLATGATIQGRVDELTADEIRDNRVVLDARIERIVQPKKASLNMRGRKPEYNADEDTAIYSRWEQAQSAGRMAAQAFLEAYQDIFPNKAIKARLILFGHLRDRVRKKRSAVIKRARLKK